MNILEFVRNQRFRFILYTKQNPVNRIVGFSMRFQVVAIRQCDFWNHHQWVSGTRWVDVASNSEHKTNYLGPSHWTGPSSSVQVPGRESVICAFTPPTLLSTCKYYYYCSTIQYCSRAVNGIQAFSAAYSDCVLKCASHCSKIRKINPRYHSVLLLLNKNHEQCCKMQHLPNVLLKWLRGRFWIRKVTSILTGNW